MQEKIISNIHRRHYFCTISGSIHVNLNCFGSLVLKKVLLWPHRTLGTIILTNLIPTYARELHVKNCFDSVVVQNEPFLFL
jgi:hypothetical protein